MRTVAVLGTGDSGSAMARRLRERGFSVRAWNRTEARARPLESDGVAVFPTSAEAVRTADVVLVTVFDATAVLDVIGQIASFVEPGAVVAQCATIGDDIEAVIARAGDLGVPLLDAPFLGNPGPARRGELTIMVAGAPDHKRLASPVFEALATNVVDVADRPGGASRLKLACNTWLFGMNAVAAQAAVLAESFGLDSRLFLRAVSGSNADSAYLHYRSAQLTGATDAVLSPVRAAVKDLAHIRAAAVSAGIPDLLLGRVEQLYTRAADAGLGDRDLTAVRAVLDGQVMRRQGAEPAVLDGIHHLKFPVSDVDRSLAWWERAFGAVRRPHLDHRTPEGVLFGYVIAVPGVQEPVELRLAPGSAGAVSGFDPVTFAAPDRSAVQAWVDRFEAAGVANSGLLRGLNSWLVVVHDPDGVPIRICSRETHAWDAEGVDFDSPWITPLVRDQL
ncbi:NAD(P)-binding domain-containing protein [Streptomyces sp. WP-1]|uniref:NAD(P)-binding domain-containing protein n=1 Tax=Streptomyces sp. WP-1 TaxID=3041497 RepID=UPI00264790D4|nr:NAD(P)-binding domain-containing protein [Streptomyces sp. WP-1]WKE73535.1 NAD(P)-binding domain-containing protein [Streptomyces sp. WP-1]